MPALRGLTLVWLRVRGKDAKALPFVAGRVTGQHIALGAADGRVRVMLDDEDGETATPIIVGAADLLPRNPAGTRPDCCMLLHLNEACVLENIAARFAAGNIYTWTSHVLTAVNPYEELPLYSESLIVELPVLPPRELPPHVFSVAEMAVRNVPRSSQAVIVSGESGAGKTVSMAHVMVYLTRRARAAGSADGDLGLRLGTLLLQSNPVLEAFGNAQTVRNHNSSRFGKFIKVAFDQSGTRMSTMSLKTYLLEKVRVVSPGSRERTYHVFYALLAGASPEQSKLWGLRGMADHALTMRASDRDAAASAGSAMKFDELCKALSALSVRPEEIEDLLGLVSAVLHLRDVHFVPLADSDDGGCRPVGSAALAHAVKLLGCPGISLKLVQRVILTGRGAEPVTVSLSSRQASSARDALCKSVYVAIFEHICRRFNEAAASIGAQIRSAELQRKKEESKETGPSPSGRMRRSYERDDHVELEGQPSPTAANSTMSADGPFIALLDMFGFECFEINSFEQLCINLANERLQSYFQQCVFSAEEEVHRLEGVPWPSEVEYHDNRGCVSLISGLIFHLLDEACSLQSNTEPGFFARVAEQSMRDPFFASARRNKLREDEGFIVRHFAGDVCYISAAAADSSGGNETASCDTWLVKNADRLLPELAVELKGSSMPLVVSLFAGAEAGDRGLGKSKASVAQRFCDELDSLLLDLSRTHARFVRCIKPNGAAKAKVLERASVLSQLRCLGMTEVVTMMHKAFPTRIPYISLHGRYATGMPEVLANLAPRDFCEAVALVCDVPPEDMHLGTTRLFLRGGKGAFLEDLGDMDVATAMPLLRAKIDSMNARRSAGKLIACAVCMVYLRERYQRMRRASAFINRVWRGFEPRKSTRSERQRLCLKRQEAAAKRQSAAPAVASWLARVESDGAEDLSPIGEGEDAESIFAAETANVTHGHGPQNGPEESTALPATTKDQTLLASLGINLLGAAQDRAVRALRQRLGEHIAENTDVVPTTLRTVFVPGVDDSQPPVKMDLPPRRRLRVPTTSNMAATSSGAVIHSPSKDVASTVETKVDVEAQEQLVEVHLARDARDGTLGIDLDQFTGRPTIAVVVPDGPAERDGSVRAGDIISAINGIECASISEVIAVLSSPAVAAKSPLPVMILRRARFAVVDDNLLVRTLPRENACDGLAGINDVGSVLAGTYGGPAGNGLHKLTQWSLCRCLLFSDRRVAIVNRKLGVDATFSLRSTEMVALVIIPKSLSISPGDQQSRNCLQMRTTDGIIEMCAPNSEQAAPPSLLAWQRPLEDMLMRSLSPVTSGWLYNLSASTTSGEGVPYQYTPRIYFDLNNLSQLWSVMDQKRPQGTSHIGVIELAEVQTVKLVKLTEPLSDYPALGSTTEVLHMSSNNVTCVLACEQPEATARWANELAAAHRCALVALLQYTSMILIDGWLEYQGDEDEWASGFFILTIGSGLQCFEAEVVDLSTAEPIETLPLGDITGAVRSKGIDYYDWCIDVRTTEADYIRVRPPRQSEMSRWLATLNLYCTPPPKSKPEKPTRQMVPSQEMDSSTKISNHSMEAQAAGMVSDRENQPLRTIKGPQGRAPVPEGMPTPPRTGLAAVARSVASNHSANAKNVVEQPRIRSLAPSPQGGPISRASSFESGVRRLSLSFTRRSSRSNASTSAKQQPVGAQPSGKSRGGRLHAAKMPEEQMQAKVPHIPQEPTRSVLRRPSFTRKRAVKTDSDLSGHLQARDLVGIVTPAPFQVESKAREAPMRRAVSFTRGRKKWAGAPAAAPQQESEVTAKSALIANAPPRPRSTEGLGVKIVRRAASFGRRQPRAYASSLNEI